MTPTLTVRDIAGAHARIRDHVRRTPALELGEGAFGQPGQAVLKLEFLQHAGSFKTRGAFNAILAGEVPAAGVAAASGGNHGAAVAYAAMRTGHPARIFVPEIANPAKIEMIRRFGAEIVIGGSRYADAQERCDAYVQAAGATLVHPFSSLRTMAGQGTVALEWDEQAEALDTVLVATGGGGLVAGMSAWWADPAASRRPRLIAVEPENSRALQAAFEAGGPVDVEVESVAADSLGARNVGPLVYGVARPGVERVVLVTDAAITAAQRVLWRDLRIATEPGGAAAAAALMSGTYRAAPGERVGILICGANVDARGLAGLAG